VTKAPAVLQADKQLETAAFVRAEETQAARLSEVRFSKVTRPLWRQSVRKAFQRSDATPESVPKAFQQRPESVLATRCTTQPASHSPVAAASPEAGRQRPRSVHFCAHGQIGTRPVPGPCSRGCQQGVPGSSRRRENLQTFKMTV
jgi:hypothetical protein